MSVWEGLAFAWHDDPERGLRAIVSVWIRARPVLVVLYPASDPLGDAWNLGQRVLRGWLAAPVREEP